ncbi:MAG TPA: hypothetical protein VES65_08645 [Solirubrobacteraceae bacterium]|nr:hypothetical protein [Solirubrobacteraceae bacterium]
MRRLRMTAMFLAMGMLAIGGLAYASTQFTQEAKITLTATKAGKSTGFKASLKSADPGAVQPQGLKTLTVTFPTNTKFNFKSTAIKQCKASSTEIKATLGSACPAKSKLGVGTATANGAPVLPVIPENVTAYAGKNEIVFFLSPSGPVGQLLVLRGKVSANKLTVAVPVIKEAGLNIVITSLKLTIKAVGSGKQAFVTAGKCTSKKFVVKSSFVYQTGAKLSRSSSSKCSS